MDYVLEMNNIVKEFPGVRALSNVSFKVKRGEIHALCGENGAGKSTLMKVLSGVYPYGTYEGSIVIDGKEMRFANIKEAEEAGIAIIYQELTLVKQLSVGENIFLGNEPNVNGIINWDQLYFDSKKWLKEVGLNISPETKVANLGVGQQQLIEIAKALAKNAKILVLDEPTAALAEGEVENLMHILSELRKKGVTCIYISHKLEEVFKIADRVTVLRDGVTISTNEVKDLNEDRIISMMVGREMNERFPRVSHTPSDVVLEVKNFTVYDMDIPNKKIVDNVSFKARRGEILGVSGLVGAGRSELMMAIFGAYPGRYEGEVYIEGKKVNINNPVDAIKAGIGLLSEDRKRYGLVLLMDVLKNITLSSLDKVSNGGVLNSNEEIKYSNKYVKEIKIKTPSLETCVNNLSGGNQQKVVIAKWLMTNPKVLILDEPTRGIDVGAKFEIYNIMNELIEKGVVIIMVSSELPEILGMSDRILVMHEGKINGEYIWSEATSEKIMYSATGGR
jgi:D-xylose ABC transporter ATP-binding protein